MPDIFDQLSDEDAIALANGNIDALSDEGAILADKILSQQAAPTEPNLLTEAIKNAAVGLVVNPSSVPFVRMAGEKIQESPVGEYLPSWGDVGSSAALSLVPGAGAALKGTKIAAKVLPRIPRALQTLGKFAGLAGASTAGREAGEIAGNVPESERLGLGAGLVDAVTQLGAERVLTRLGAVSDEALDEAATLYRKVAGGTVGQLKKGIDVVEGEVVQQLDDSAKTLIKAGAFKRGVRSPEDVYTAAVAAQRDAETTITKLAGKGARVSKDTFWGRVRGIIDEMAEQAVTREGQEELLEDLANSKLLEAELTGLIKTSGDKGILMRRLLNLKRDWAGRTKWDKTATPAQQRASAFWRNATGKLAGAIDGMFDDAFPKQAGKLKEAHSIWGAAQDLIPVAKGGVAKNMRGGSTDLTRLVAQGGAMAGVGYLGASALPNGPSPGLTALMFGLPALSALGISTARSPGMRGLRGGVLTTASRIMGALPRSAEAVFEDGAEFIGALTRLGANATIINEAHELIGTGNLRAMDRWLSQTYAANPALAAEAEPSPLPGFNVIGGKLYDETERYAFGEQRKKELSGRKNANQLTEELAALNEDGSILKITIEPEDYEVSVPQPVELHTTPVIDTFASNIRKVDKPY